MLSLATTVAIRAGAVIDGISIEKSLVFHQFGFCSNPQHCNANNQFILDEGEKVQSITYGRSSNTSYLNRPCKLSLQTNKRVLGPFSNHRCSEPIYRVDIPSEMMLVDYFTQYSKTKSTWTSHGMKPFFNGFTSEYTTS